MRTSTKDEYEEIGRTEVINDDLNPNFLEKILLEYTFERNQYLKFELYVHPPDLCKPSAPPLIATRLHSLTQMGYRPKQ